MLLFYLFPGPSGYNSPHDIIYALRNVLNIAFVYFKSGQQLFPSKNCMYEQYLQPEIEMRPDFSM